jgi:hypothetical protein
MATLGINDMSLPAGRARATTTSAVIRLPSRARAAASGHGRAQSGQRGGGRGP